MKEYVENFITDLEFGKIGEQITASIFNKLTNGKYNYTIVGHLREYRHIGDIICHNRRTGKETVIEVKNDTRISETGNVLCEIENFYNDTNERRKGNIYNDSEIYVVVSMDTQKIYVLRQARLREIMVGCRLIDIHHRDQTTTAYLVPLSLANEKEALIATVDYSDEEHIEVEYGGWL